MFSYRPTRKQAEYIEALDWQHEQPYAPDGLSFWDVLSVQSAAYKEIVDSPRPTSALLDGSAAERRRRRIERRAISAVVRSLPVRPVMTEPEDEVA